MKRLIRTYRHKLPYISSLHEQVKKQEEYINSLREQVKKQGEFPAGHYHSPIPSYEDIHGYIKSREPQNIEVPDIKLNKEIQFKLLEEYSLFYDELPFPENQTPDIRYYYNQSWFCYADAIFLYSFLRKHTPGKIIEIGSDFSTAVMLDTIDRFFSHRPEITLVEPYPDRLKSLLKDHDNSYVNIIDKKVQDIPIQIFSTLEPGDFLFIDSSHVLKCGSDLELILFEILPLLSPGIFVHFHDDFYPFTYPYLSRKLLRRFSIF